MSAYKLGIDPQEYGTSDHAIRVAGVHYEIGVVKRTDGKGWSLVWEFLWVRCGHQQGHR